MNKKKTTKKESPPVDSRSYVVDSLSKASSSIENAFNAVNSLDYSTLTSATTSYIPNATWDFGHTTSSNIVTPTPTVPVISSNTATYQNNYLQVPYYDSSNLYPKIDIEKRRYINSDEHSHDYLVMIYLAGVSKERVQLAMEKGSYLGSVFYPPKLTIQIVAEKEALNQPVHKDWFLKESKQSFTNRIVNLPPDSDVHNATEAILNNGVLTFSIPIVKNPETPAEVVHLKIS